jgi:hypothetical protein
VPASREDSLKHLTHLSDFRNRLMNLDVLVCFQGIQSIRLNLLLNPLSVPLNQRQPSLHLNFVRFILLKPMAKRRHLLAEPIAIDRRQSEDSEYIREGVKMYKQQQHLKSGKSGKCATKGKIGRSLSSKSHFDITKKKRRHGTTSRSGSVRSGASHLTSRD